MDEFQKARLHEIQSQIAAAALHWNDKDIELMVSARRQIEVLVDDREREFGWLFRNTRGHRRSKP